MAKAAAWQRQYRATGSQPWHLDAGLTALSFTGDHLGFGKLCGERARRAGYRPRPFAETARDAIEWALRTKATFTNPH